MLKRHTKCKTHLLLVGLCNDEMEDGKSVPCDYHIHILWEEIQLIKEKIFSTSFSHGLSSGAKVVCICIYVCIYVCICIQGVIQLQLKSRLVTKFGIANSWTHKKVLLHSLFFSLLLLLQCFWFGFSIYCDSAFSFYLLGFLSILLLNSFNVPWICIVNFLLIT